MQESGPTSPAAKQPNAARPGRNPDPVVRWLTLAIAGVVILWLVGILSAMMFGLLSPANAPRTSAERDLRVLAAETQSGKATTQTYAQYVSTLISAGELNKAQQALDEALATAKTDRSFLYAQQADLALARKDYQGTVTAANTAMAEAEKELKAFMANNVKNNRAPTAGATVPTSFADAALAKAQALYASKDYKGAIAAFDVYLKQSPTDSDILVERAQIKLLVGDKAGAAADYRAALKYIPDYQPALDGLKQIGAAK
ncbi:MAG: tetratricopeptide repeat protein [Coriobacteriia bacterium]|nr:tetratricopeptide repeat protein [Coriobacteriia bacterium]